MKESPAHLPKCKQSELKRIVHKIRAFANPEKIILFGSYARGDWKDGPHKQGKGRLTIHKKSDYDILVIVADKAEPPDEAKICRKVQNKCDKMKLSTHVRVIVRNIKFVNEKLAEGQYFFKDIKKEGVLLYDSGCYGLSFEIEQYPAEQRRIAQEYFDEWFTNAKDFYLGYQMFLEKRKYKLAAFNLHQAAEHAYKAVLLVFTNYCPDEHYLQMLGVRAARHQRALRSIFPKKTKQQRELFSLLDYAYIGARYDKTYKITNSRLEQLAKYVQKLHRLTERICRKKIESLYRW